VPQQWDVFFSHSTRLDGDTFTDRLTAGTYARLTTAGRRVFWDRKCSIGESILVQALRDHIDRSRVAVLFINGLFLSSPWVELEMDHVARRLAAGRLRVLWLKTAPGVREPSWLSRAAMIEVDHAAPIQESVREICARVEDTLALPG
jgi:hypothetical protein